MTVIGNLGDWRQEYSMSFCASLRDSRWMITLA